MDNQNIKEILESLQYNEHIGTNDKRKLREYITNLQQELAEYKDTETYSKRFLYKANKDRLNANLELVKENERLKEGYCELKVKCNNGECDCSYEEYHDMCEKNMEMDLLLEDYKSRCKKAVEYVEQHKFNKFGDIDCGEAEAIIDILNGKE